MRSRAESLPSLCCRSTKDLSDRKSTRLNSSHSQISYAVFCLKKNKTRLDKRPTLNNHYPHHSRPHYHLLPVSNCTGHCDAICEHLQPPISLAYAAAPAIDNHL